MPAYCFFINYPAEWLNDQLKGNEKIHKVHNHVMSKLKRAKGLIMGVELNEKGNKHTQGWVVYKKDTKMIDIQKKCTEGICNDGFDKQYMAIKISNSDWDHNYAYIHHDGKHADKGLLWDFWAHGSAESTKDYLTKQKHQGDRTDLKLFAKDIQEKGLDQAFVDNPIETIKFHRGARALRQAHLRLKRKAEGFINILVFVLIGFTGAGKSRKARELANGSYYNVPAPGKDLRLWFDNYDGEETIIFDDIIHKVDFPCLLNCLDGYAAQFGVKGDFTTNGWRQVIITSNYDPRTWFEKEDCEPLWRRITKIEYFQSDNRKKYTFEDIPKIGFKKARTEAANVPDDHAEEGPADGVDQIVPPIIDLTV